MKIKIPLVSDHIDGDPKNNNLDNFRIICNNCDSILPTFKGKNRGKGRKDRYNNNSTNSGGSNPSDSAFYHRIDLCDFKRTN